MLVREAISRIMSLYSKGAPSKDSRLTERHIYSGLLSARATVLRNQANKGQFVSDWAYQHLPCVKLINAPISECPCAPQKCTILRTEKKLPQPISSLDDHLIQTVSTIDGNRAFDRTTFGEAKYAIGNKYTATKPLYYIRNGYAYFVNEHGLKNITMTGLYADPIAAFLFGDSCDSINSLYCGDIREIPFPIDAEQDLGIFQLAANELIFTFAQMRQDITNDASDDAGASGKMVHTPQAQDQ